jgi:dTDP-4-dehydrorhamnose reductase
MTQVVVLGAGGMLGSQLVAELQQAQADVIGFNRIQCDVASASQVTKALRQHKPDWVFNCAAYTAVDAAESHQQDAFDVNATGAENVAAACAELGARCVYISTDYVFDGGKAEPYLESDAPNPLNVYGRSKLEGERRTAAAWPERHVIVRTSGIYGRGGRNFVDAMLQRARRGESVRVVNDQVGAPTSAAVLARVLVEFVKTPAAHGIYHATCSGSCSWFEFARAIFEIAGYSPDVVAPIRSSDYPSPAVRPLNSRLANTRLAELRIAALPAWQTALEEFIASAQLEQC